MGTDWPMFWATVALDVLTAVLAFGAILTIPRQIKKSAGLQDPLFMVARGMRQLARRKRTEAYTHPLGSQELDDLLAEDRLLTALAEELSPQIE